MDFRGMRKGDFILIVVLIGIGVATFLVNRFFEPRRPVGNNVQIEIDGVLSETFPLSKDLKTKIETENGYNVVEIADEKVHIVEANCPDQLCVYSGWKQRIGQIIVCLPHRLILRISGEDEDKLDGITY